MIQITGWIGKGEFNRLYNDGVYSNHKWEASVDTTDFNLSYENIAKWCKTNTTGLVTHFYALIYFENEEDALAFKLTFS